MLLQVHYFWPLECGKKKEFENRWHELTRLSGGRVVSETIPVMFGRYSSFFFSSFILLEFCLYNSFSIIIYSLLLSEHWMFLKAVMGWHGLHLSFSAVSRYYVMLYLTKVPSTVFYAI